VGQDEVTRWSPSACAIYPAAADPGTCGTLDVRGLTGCAVAPSGGASGWIAVLALVAWLARRRLVWLVR